MQEPAIPSDEAERVAALHQLCVLDTAPEERFDRVTRIARQLFGVDFVLVSLVDSERQWFKSNQGLAATETARNISFCGHAILGTGALVVEDAAADVRFADNRLVTGAPHIRFYAGVPVHGPNGYPVGTLCLIDRKPRRFNTQERAALADLGAMIDVELNTTTLERAIGEATDGAARLRAIFDNVIDGIVTTNEAGVIETINGAALRVFGYQADELIGRHISVLLPNREDCGPDGLAAEQALIDSISGNGSEAYARRKDGSLFPAELGFSPMLLNDALHFTGIVRDLTERKQIEAIQGQFAAIIASSSDAVLSKTLDGIITSWNPAARAMFGYAESDVLGRPAALLLPPALADEEQGILARIRAGDRVDPFETWRLRKDGVAVPVSVTVSPIKDGAGHIIGASTIARDITELRQKQQMLEEAKRDAERASLAKGEFLANMSHEIRTPMNAVLGMAHLLGTTMLTDEQRRYLDMIRISGKSLLGIINDVLDLSKIEAGKMDLAPAPFRLADVLDALATIMGVNAGEKDLELVIGVDAGVPPTMVGDALRLQQVLVNLTGNAIKFTARGEVSLQVHCLARDEDNTTLRFVVRDTGIGMDAAHLARMFDAFSQADSSVTRRFGGTGLGLSISRHLVALMGSAIDVRSTPGAGSEFAFTLTLARAGNEAADGAAHAHEHLKLLLIYESDTGRHYLQQSMESPQWQVDCCACATDAVQAMRDTMAAGERYDLVLLDWNVLERSGQSMLQDLRAMVAPEALPAIVMVSAFGRGQLAAGSALCGADALLTKPVTSASLFAAIEQVVFGAARCGQPFVQAASARIDACLLLVEDNRLNQVVAKNILEQGGARVDVAEDGQQALDMLRQDPERYDLVLMDVQMPVMDGYTATRLIRTELGLKLPVLAMTAGVLDTERIQCAVAGMGDLVAKPIDVDQLFAALRRHLPLARAGLRPNVATAPVDDALIDLKPLLSIAAGKPQVAETTIRLIRQTVAQAAPQMAAARQHWQGGRHREAAHIFHTLRGAVGSLGARRFVHAASAAERAITAGGQDAAHVDALLLRAEQEMAAVANAVAAALTEAVFPASALALPQLQALQQLLETRDMRAGDVYSQLRTALRGQLSDAQFAELDSAMDGLDFDTAQRVLAAAAAGN